MQYLAIIDREEVIFVDSLNYAVHDGQGGRLIVQSWMMDMHSGQDSLSEPVAIERIYYNDRGEEIQRRLMSEIPQALKLFEERQRGGAGQCLVATILPFRGQTTP